MFHKTKETTLNSIKETYVYKANKTQANKKNRKEINNPRRKRLDIWTNHIQLFAHVSVFFLAGNDTIFKYKSTNSTNNVIYCYQHLTHTQNKLKQSKSITLLLYHVSFWIFIIFNCTRCYSWD
jgi:hypothetical protein